MTYVVVIAEKNTGKVLHPDGVRHREGDPDYRLRFDDVEAARAFGARHAREYPQRECLVLDDAGTCVGIFR